MLKKEEVEMEAYNLSTDVSEELEELKKFNPIFNIQNFFALVNKRNHISGVPFIIGAKDLNFDCIYMRKQKLTNHDGHGFFCVFLDHIDEYATSGSKIVSCKNCLNNSQ